MTGRSFCGQDHAGHPGVLDESARRLSHEELAAARLLAGEGHLVRSQPERGGAGRTADLDVCGVPVEIKSWLPLLERDGRPPGPRSVLNKILDARDQAPVAVLNAGRSGLSAAAARAGLALYAARADRDRLAVARIVGDGFDLSWTPARQLLRSSQTARRERPYPAPRLERGWERGW